MAIQSKRNFLGAMRIDTNMLRAIESGVVSDFATLVNQVLTSGDPNTQTYVVRGFNHTGTTRSTFTVSLADSVFLSQNAGRSMFVFPSDTSDVVPFLNAASGIYYWGFKVAETDAVVQSFAFKDPITNVEYTKTVPTTKELAYIEPYYDTEGTRTDVTFIYRVTVSGNTVTVNGLADVSTNLTRYFLEFDGTSYESLTDWADAIAASVADKTVGGDLSGTYPDATVIGLQGVPVSDTLPSVVGQVLGYNGSKWGPTNLPVKSVASSDSTITVTNTSGAVDVKLNAPVAVSKGGTGLNASGVTSGQILVGVDSGGGFKLQDVNGDASMTNLGKVTVEGWKDLPLDNTMTTPLPGQVPVWSGSAWAPATQQGGGGGGGLVLYMNYANGESPAPASSRELSYQYDEHVSWNTGDITAPNSTTPVTIATFVTKINSPGVEVIPAGIWDLNVWLSSDASSNETAVRLSVYIWNGVTETLKATSDYTYISGPANTPAEYKVSVYVPLIDTSLTDRVEIVIEGRRFVSASHTVKGYFGNSTISHVHTSINAVGGTGLQKVVNGYLQSPASLLVDADVSNTAGIKVKKLENGLLSQILVAGASELAYKTMSGDATIDSNGQLTLNTVTVSKGGTGVTSLVPNALLVGGTTVGGLTGTATGQLPTWNGTSWVASPPAFTGTVTSVTSSSSVSGLALSTATGTSTPVITLTGTLNVAGGGTGLSSLTSGSYVVGGGTSVVLKTPTEVTADLDSFTGSLKGLVPVSAGETNKYLRADGNWAAVSTASYYAHATILAGLFTATTTESYFNNWILQQYSNFSTDATSFRAGTNGDGYYLVNISGLLEVTGFTTDAADSIRVRIRAGSLSGTELSHFYISPNLPVSTDTPKYLNREKVAFSHTATVFIGSTTPSAIVVTLQLMGGTSVTFNLVEENRRGMSITLSKVGAEFSGQQSGVFVQTPSTTQPLTAASSQITPNAGIVKVNPSSNNLTIGVAGSPVILTSGVAEGTRLTIVNVSTSNTLKISGGATYSTQLSNPTVSLAPWKCLEVVYISNGTNSYWCELTHTQ